MLLYKTQYFEILCLHYIICSVPFVHTTVFSILPASRYDPWMKHTQIVIVHITVAQFISNYQIALFYVKVK